MISISPVPMSIAKILTSQVVFMDYMEAIREADVILLLVDHKEFKALDADALQGKIVIDTRGIWA